MVVPRSLLVEKVIKDERKVLALRSVFDGIKRNQAAVEKATHGNFLPDIVDQSNSAR